MTTPMRRGLAHQAGMATLFTTLVLLLALAVISLTVTRLAVSTQEAAGGDVRTREAFQGANGSVDFALAYFADPVTTPLGTTGTQPVAVPADTLASGYQYGYTTSGNMPAHDWLIVNSQAAHGLASGEEYISSRATMLARRMFKYLTRAGAGAPPLVLNGCMKLSPIRTMIYPDDIAVLTLATTTPLAGALKCLKPAMLDLEQCDTSGDSVYAEACPYVAGTPASVAVPNKDVFFAGIDGSALPTPRAWSYLFSIALADAKAEAASFGQVYNHIGGSLNPTDSPFIHYTGGGNIAGGFTFGAADNPIVLIISDDDCPTLDETTKVYGFIYYEAGKGRCDLNFGGAETIGSVVVEGNVVGDFHSKAPLWDISQLGVAQGTRTGLAQIEVAPIPGSWRDW